MLDDCGYAFKKNQYQTNSSSPFRRRYLLKKNFAEKIRKLSPRESQQKFNNKPLVLELPENIDGMLNETLLGGTTFISSKNMKTNQRASADFTSHHQSSSKILM